VRHLADPAQVSRHGSRYAEIEKKNVMSTEKSDRPKSYWRTNLNLAAVLPGEDAALFETVLSNLEVACHPGSLTEQLILEQMAATECRLARGCVVLSERLRKPIPRDWRYLIARVNDAGWRLIRISKSARNLYERMQQSRRARAAEGPVVRMIAPCDDRWVM
jgi:hypothetical protein